MSDDGWSLLNSVHSSAVEFSTNRRMAAKLTAQTIASFAAHFYEQQKHVAAKLTCGFVSAPQGNSKKQWEQDGP
jgi:hypothetical protein